MSPFLSLYSEFFKSHLYRFVGETMWKAVDEKENDRQEPLCAHGRLRKSLTWGIIYVINMDGREGDTEDECDRDWKLNAPSLTKTKDSDYDASTEESQETWIFS